jgi:hypothetical protein
MHGIEFGKASITAAQTTPPDMRVSVTKDDLPNITKRESIRLDSGVD